ncbi:unnamed protein product [Pleuronectes platessa]|uniref:Uncharacterized protein n=1 Tax=Pleuronectes platessa TaxID=8262 RepID=A0A9N7VP33_PLEPL|nr:unnamed protein product [Pleuronectes platessa]
MMRDKALSSANPTSTAPFTTTSHAFTHPGHCAVMITGDKNLNQQPPRLSPTVRPPASSTRPGLQRRRKTTERGKASDREEERGVWGGRGRDVGARVRGRGGEVRVEHRGGGLGLG